MPRRDECQECGKISHDVVYSYKFAAQLCLKCWDVEYEKAVRDGTL